MEEDNTPTPPPVKDEKPKSFKLQKKVSTKQCLHTGLISTLAGFFFLSWLLLPGGFVSLVFG